MFPDVGSTKIKKTQSAYPNYIDDVLDFLIQERKYATFDIMIFWGSSVYIPVSVESKLKILQNSCQIYTIGTVNTPHQHPGRNVSVKTIKFTLNNLSSIQPNSRYLK